MKSKIFTKVCFIGLVAIISTGCAARYGCKAPEGKSCSSITDVYTENLQGEKKPEVKVELEEEAEPAREPDTKTAPVEPIVLPSHVTTSNTPTISAPKVLRIWVAPWEDNDGDLHEPGYIYLQVDKGKWKY